MALPYLKIEAEEAIQIIDVCITSGYIIKDRVNKEYFENPTKATENIPQWQASLNEWTGDVLEKLDSIFVSQKELYNFRDAPRSPFIREGNIQWSGIINRLEARIGKLNEYDRYIREQFSVHIEVVGRDKITQIGDATKTEVLN